MAINDPHIKADPDWTFFCAARDGGHFVKNREGGVYHGTCWPGIEIFIIMFQYFPISVLCCLIKL